MKYVPVIFCIILACGFSFSTPTACAEDWLELKSEHFIVYFTRDEKFAKEISNKAEFYYRKIGSDLGYSRYSEFWTWDNRVKIYIYPDEASFLANTGQPEWSKGVADYKKKRIISFAWSEGFLEMLLPHEMAHLIFRDFVGFKGEVPLWLDEGVAQWEEEEKRIRIKTVAAALLKNAMLIPLEDMMRLDIRAIKEKEVVYIHSTPPVDGKGDTLFLSGDNLVHTYYIEAASLVGFMIEKYGSDNFAHFCRQLRDGKSLEEALRFAYPNRMADVKSLEKEWNRYLLE
jgi:hypothetical protein